LCALLFVAECRSAVRAAREQAASGNSAARAVTDEVGRRVAVPARVKRIVTLAPNLTETIYALGLEDKLAGDTDYCDTPPAAKAKPHVGAPLNPSLEAIVALRPDLVLATTSINRRETVDALERLGIAVYTSDPHTVRGMLNSIAEMAALIEPSEGASQKSGAASEASADAKGAAFVARLEARLDALHARLQDLPLVHVLFVVWEDPLISIGQNTFIADALRWAGAESVILSKQNWPQVTFEEVVRLEPEYIVLASAHTGEGQRTTAELRGRAGWKELPAVESGHIAIISEEIDRPSPGLINAIEQLAQEIHPEAFGKKTENRNWKMENKPNFEDVAAVREECAGCAR
jgi:iron complex transport system substrate-binding protein